MASDQVQLTASMRANLLQLQRTEANIGKKENILSTGNKINSALDGPTSYFASKNLSTRASDLSSLKDAMGQSISTIQAANTGLEKISDLIDQAKGLTTSAYSALGDDEASIATRKNLAEQFNQLLKSIDELAGDSGYAGKNLLAGDGTRLDSTQTSRAAVNTLTGLSNTRVTNVISSDTYSVRVRGDGAINGKASDISDAERDHGLTGLNLSGTMSGTYGSFSDFGIEVRGSVGKTRSFVLTDGNETRTINYFDNNQTATTTQTQAATTTIPGVQTVAISGTIEAGDIFTVKVEGQTFSYTATDADVAPGVVSADAVAQALQASINAAIASGGRLASSDLASVSLSNNTLTLTGKTDTATPPSKVRELTVSSETVNSKYLHISESFASGSIISFTVDRVAMENATNGGNGTAQIQKQVNIQVDVTNLTGTSITRDGMNARGEGKLADGENSFSFNSGTVRIDLDEATIRGAATANESANIITNQVSAANTQNDLTVQFNEKNTSSINIKSENMTTSGQGLHLDEASNDWMDRSDIDEAVANIEYAKNYLRSVSQNLSTNLNIVTTREDFTKEFSDVLTEGSNKLIAADQNEEAANLLALQTRQQLGTTALSLANQSQQSILKLF